MDEFPPHHFVRWTRYYSDDETIVAQYPIPTFSEWIVFTLEWARIQAELKPIPYTTEHLKIVQSKPQIDSLLCWKWKKSWGLHYENNKKSFPSNQLKNLFRSPQSGRDGMKLKNVNLCFMDGAKELPVERECMRLIDFHLCSISTRLPHKLSSSLLGRRHFRFGIDKSCWVLF